MRTPPIVNLLAFLVVVIFAMPALYGQDTDGIDPEALIETILSVDTEQRYQIQDITYQTEFFEGKNKDEGFEEKVRFIKNVYVKYLPDTTLFYEEFLEFYEDGELKSAKDRDRQARERREKRLKRKARDVSYPMLTPFYPTHRDLYDIEYKGVDREAVDGYVCHHFEVRAKEEVDSLINGRFYFEAESFHLVQVDFSPAKLVKNIMFKLKKLDMTIKLGPTTGGYWLPIEFRVDGKGKAGLLFGVNFAGREYYRNPVINSGLETELFEGTSDE